MWQQNFLCLSFVKKQKWLVANRKNTKKTLLLHDPIEKTFLHVTSSNKSISNFWPPNDKKGRRRRAERWWLFPMNFTENSSFSDVLPGRKRLSWDTYTWEFHYQLVLLENPFMAYCMSSFFSKKILKSQKVNLVSLSLGRPWRHILSQFHSDDEKHRANSELHIKKAFACTISVETYHISLLYMIDTTMERGRRMKESQGKKPSLTCWAFHTTLLWWSWLLSYETTTQRALAWPWSHQSTSTTSKKLS